MTNDADVRTEGWGAVCGICGLADTARCRACPTRSRAVRRMCAAWHARHRYLVAYVAVGFSVAAALQVAR